MDDLSPREWDIFFNLLKNKCPKYNVMKDWDYFEINDALGEPGYLTWEQAYYILMEIKENSIN